MTIRLSLLAILDEGDCYGYQLRVEFERRTGHYRSLNVGQVYATLDRLERDGLVCKLGANSTGHVYYAITDEGRIGVRSWFETAAPSVGLDELAQKVALAQSLPGVDAAAVVSRHWKSTADAAGVPPARYGRATRGGGGRTGMVAASRSVGKGFRIVWARG